MASKQTLFHLVPANQDSYEALSHPDNKRFVSPSSKEGKLGLEIGYHVPSIPGGHVITRLGRNSDLILRQNNSEKPVSAVHVSFELNPVTQLVLLSVRSKHIASVKFKIMTEPKPGSEEQEDNTEPGPEDGPEQEEEITGDGVILYGQNYLLTIASYIFELVWRKLWRQLSGRKEEDENPNLLKTLAVQGYEESMQRWRDARSRDRATEHDNSEIRSWHFTRLRTANKPVFKEISGHRTEIGRGEFGTVSKAIDYISGYPFAIKVIDLEKHRDLDSARALFHREIKNMMTLHHDHIVGCFGYEKFDTLKPEIFMPLLDGNLTSLSGTLGDDNADELCQMVLEQMLSALDYLHSQNLIHRDVKPDNILYFSHGEGKYVFQLADFGLADHRSLAITVCGTGLYQAPELWPQFSKINAAQSFKLDIWSLIASIMDIHPSFHEFPPRGIISNYNVVLSALKAAMVRAPRLEAMARLHPDRRASAAQMLVERFDGRGLTTPRSKVPSIQPDAQEPPVAGPSNNPQPRNYRGKAPQVLGAARRPLVVYPPAQQRHPRHKEPPVLPNRVPDARVFKRQPGPVAARLAADKRLDRRRLLERQLHQQQWPNTAEQVSFDMPGTFPTEAEEHDQDKQG